MNSVKCKDKPFMFDYIKSTRKVLGRTVVTFPTNVIVTVLSTQ